MDRPIAVLAEPDRPFRELMRDVVRAVGFDVFETSSAAQLEEALRMPRVLTAEKALLVLSVRVATACVAAIVAATEQRSRLRLPFFHVALTCEFGTLAGLKPPHLGPCFVIVLEKPFDIQQLQAIAQTCAQSGSRAVQRARMS